MKRMKKIIAAIMIAPLLFVASNVNAAGASLSVSSGTVEVGQSFTANVNMVDAAAWNIHVTAGGPVSGCTLAAADATEDAMNTSRTFAANCVATGEGTITVSLSGDVTSQDMANSAISGVVSVSVTAATNNTPAQEDSGSSSDNTNSSEAQTEANSASAQVNDATSKKDDTNQESASSSDGETGTKTDSEKSKSSTSIKNVKKTDEETASNEGEEENKAGTMLPLVITIVVVGIGLIVAGIIFWVRPRMKAWRLK